jgi:cell division transport system permease protein
MNRFFYLIGQGFENVWKNKLMFFASVLIITTSMITLGIFNIIGENANKIVKNMQEEQAMVAYVDENLTEEQTKNIENSISSIYGVTSVTRETKEEALKNIREQYFNDTNIDLTIGWENSNIFTDSFAIKVDDLNNASVIADKIRNIDGVRKVGFSEEIFKIVTDLASTVNLVVIVIFISLMGVSLLVISNTIKIVLHSRRKEIYIMKYIGATDNFIKTPFVIEGIIVGFAGAFLSWGITIKLYELFKNMFIDSLGFQPVILNSQLLYL